MSALVTWDDAYLGAIGPFAVGVPWWVEVEPVVGHLREALGVAVFVLRLLTVEGGGGSRDGHVTYHAAALTALDRQQPQYEHRDIEHLTQMRHDGLDL